MENKDTQEIDLGEVFSKSKDFLKSIIFKIFKIINFIKKNKIKIGFLFLLGIILGYFLDTNIKTYKQNILVTPNVKSIDYLKSKIFLLNSLLKESDTTYLYQKGFRDIKSIGKFKVNSVVDIFKFAEGNKEYSSNFNLIKLMAEDGDINKLIESEYISKNYTFHVISFTTSNKIDEKKIKDAIMNFINDNEHFQKVLNQENENTTLKINQNDSIINQIDLILESFKSSTSSSKNSSLVYYNENTQLNDVIKTKNDLISENGYLKLSLINQEKIIKDISVIFNTIDDTGINGKLILILPFILLLLYMLLINFFKFYKKYSK